VKFICKEMVLSLGLKCLPKMELGLIFPNLAAASNWDLGRNPNQTGPRLGGN